MPRNRRWSVVTLENASSDGTVLYACYTASGTLRGVAHTLGPIRADARRCGATLNLLGSTAHDMTDEIGGV